MVLLITIFNKKEKSQSKQMMFAAGIGIFGGIVILMMSLFTTGPSYPEELKEVIEILNAGDVI